MKEYKLNTNDNPKGATLESTDPRKYEEMVLERAARCDQTDETHRKLGFNVQDLGQSQGS